MKQLFTFGIIWLTGSFNSPIFSSIRSKYCTTYCQTRKKFKIQSIVWKYSQIQSYMNANHLKLGTICISSIYYNLKLFYSLIYIFEVFIFFFLSLKCYFYKDKSSPLFFFLPHHTACRTSPTRDWTCVPALEAQCFNHWTAREVQVPLY